MANEKEITLPDIGDFDAVEIIEIVVAVGDTVDAEDTLITLESDKATMDIPSPQAGTVKSISVAVGDMISEGTPIVVLDASDNQEDTSSDSASEQQKEETYIHKRAAKFKKPTRNESPTSIANPTNIESRRSKCISKSDAKHDFVYMHTKSKFT